MTVDHFVLAISLCHFIMAASQTVFEINWFDLISWKLLYMWQYRRYCIERLFKEEMKIILINNSEYKISCFHFECSFSVIPCALCKKNYLIYPEFSDTLNCFRIYPKIWTGPFYYLFCHVKSCCDIWSCSAISGSQACMSGYLVWIRYEINKFKLCHLFLSFKLCFK